MEFQFSPYKQSLQISQNFFKKVAVVNNGLKRYRSAQNGADLSTGKFKGQIFGLTRDHLKCEGTKTDQNGRFDNN